MVSVLANLCIFTHPNTHRKTNVYVTVPRWFFFSICPSFFKLCLLQKKNSNSLADKCYTMFNRLFYFAIPLTLSKSPSRETTTTFNFATPTSKMASYPHINPVAICRNVNKLNVFTFMGSSPYIQNKFTLTFFFCQGQHRWHFWLWLFS